MLIVIFAEPDEPQLLPPPYIFPVITPAFITTFVFPVIAPLFRFIESPLIVPLLPP